MWCVKVNNKLIEPVQYILGKPSKLLTKKGTNKLVRFLSEKSLAQPKNNHQMDCICGKDIGKSNIL
jgi:hypothetical protein